MKTNVEEISSIKKKVDIEIPGDQVTKEIDSFYEDLRKKAKIKGFRPGKAPRSILERHFKDYVKVEVTQKLIQDTYPTALSETNLRAVSDPLIDPGVLESGKPFAYSATFEIKPEIKVEGYLGLNIEATKEEVKDEEVEERLKALQNLHAQLKTISVARPIQTGDYAIIDYSAKMDGKPLEEGKATDFAVDVGSGRFIPALEEKLVGLRQEEEKDIEISFPEDYGFSKWAGKTIPFHVKIKEIKEKILPLLDDEFAKDLGDYSSLEDLRTQLKSDIEREKKLSLEQKLKDQMVDQLLQATPFEIPESLEEEQVKAMVSDFKLRLSTQGLDLEKVGLTEEKLRGDYREMASKQVRTFLILERISSQEGVTVSDEEADERLREISERVHQKFEVMKGYYEKNGLMPGLKTRIMTDKTLDLLLQKANVKYL
ncbi:MAG: trigger factor [Deltaproteobacteria bacterium RBG_13_47_9]|nr:MAG: trigger factor [Deltaproteobacteria bacterium RBG_13_47_9]